MDNIEILSIMQHSDSFFPTGSVSFSWGAEELINEGIIESKTDIESILVNQLTQRWQEFDRVVLVHTYNQAEQITRIQEIDNYLETLILNEEFREGSKKLGIAMLSTYESLGNQIASDYLNRVYKSNACGHQVVMQALIWKSINLSLDSIQCISAYNLCINILGAALRLGKLGHIESQSIISNLHPIIIQAISNLVPDFSEIKAYTPCVDIASMRHEVSDSRLFIN
ncbi:MAG: urease accessory UreF family protein [Pseudomonadota bacterium]